MNFPLPFKRLVKRRRLPKPLIIGVVVTCTALALAVPAAAQQTAGSTASSWSDVANVPTLDSSTAMANLKVLPAKKSCAELAATTRVAGQSIDITEYQTASASAGSPEYCAVTGHINTYIGFEILLPISTWRRRSLDHRPDRRRSRAGHPVHHGRGADDQPVPLPGAAGLQGIRERR